MTKYTIVISEKAKTDIDAFYDCILYKYKQVLTAIRNRTGLYKEILKLSNYGGSIAVSQSIFVQTMFGPCARRINYKKMAIIFTLDGNSVVIKRVIAASLIR